MGALGVESSKMAGGAEVRVGGRCGERVVRRGVGVYRQRRVYWSEAWTMICVESSNVCCLWVGYSCVL